MENTRIASFYGTFRSAIWAGGRTSAGYTLPSILEMETAIQKKDVAL